MMKTTLVLVIIITISITFSSCNKKETIDIPTILNNGNSDIPVFRRVAREVLENGWVFTFVYEDWKEANINNDIDLIRYSFYGMNIRYKYDDNYIQEVNQETEKSITDANTVTKFIPPFLMYGQGSPQQENDIRLINQEILNSERSVEELLALNPDDYNFEDLDKNMFFKLMRTALMGEAQKENTNLSYWDKPSHAFLREPSYLNGYRFQIAFLQETGYVDEIYIDILYRTGDDYKDYIQLSDIIDNNTATDEQKKVFEEITRIRNEIKETGSYLINADVYKQKVIGDIELSRLYTFLSNIHENNFEIYYESPHIEIIEN